MPTRLSTRVGAFSRPLLLSGVAGATSLLWPGFAVLAIPGALSLFVLTRVRRRTPIAPGPDGTWVGRGVRGASRPWRGARTFGAGLIPAFHLFSVAAAPLTAGLMTFGIISFHLVEDHVVTVAVAPLVYAAPSRCRVWRS